MTEERWKPHPTIPDLHISTLGNVWREPTYVERYDGRNYTIPGRYPSQMFKPPTKRNPNPYKVIRYRHQGGGPSETLSIHQLVAQTYLPEAFPLQPHQCVAHVEDDHDTNTIYSVHVTTYKNNNRSRLASKYKLDIHKARRIRELAKEGVTRKELAKRYQVDVKNIEHIINNVRWVDEPPAPQRVRNNQLTTGISFIENKHSINHLTQTEEGTELALAQTVWH